LELNPRYAVAHQWYGEYSMLMGRRDKAIEEVKYALQLEPLSLVLNFELALVYYLAGRYDQAIEQFKKTQELDPSFPLLQYLGAAYEQKGMYAEAIDVSEKQIELTKGRGFPGTLAMAGLGHVYAVTGKKREAQKILNELKQRSRREYVPALDIALIYAGLGEKDQAFKWLEKAYEERSFRMIALKVEPRWESLRTD